MESELEKLAKKKNEFLDGWFTKGKSKKALLSDSTFLSFIDKEDELINKRNKEKRKMYEQRTKLFSFI